MCYPHKIAQLKPKTVSEPEQAVHRTVLVTLLHSSRSNTSDTFSYMNDFPRENWLLLVLEYCPDANNILSAGTLLSLRESDLISIEHEHETRIKSSW